MNDDSTPATLPHIEIYTDGGCEPNPGPGGYGVVLVHPKKRAETSGGFRNSTQPIGVTAEMPPRRSSMHPFNREAVR